LGVLVLQELFRARTNPKPGTWIRLVTLMAMLGSAGYYALADDRYAITFNLTLILLALLAMDWEVSCACASTWRWALPA